MMKTMSESKACNLRIAANAAFFLGVAAALGAVAALHPALDKARVYQPAFAMTERVQEEVNSSSIALILGEARASTADLMWIKTERYLHRGVAYKPHIDADAVAHTGETAPLAGHDREAEGGEHAHEQLQGLVPDQAHDYRGFIGVLHREIQPWQAPGQPDEHTAGDELVPWFRLLTYSDPHHWRGYLIGTWWLSKMNDPHALAEAGAFIQEGIRNNPEAFQLDLMDGRIKIQQGSWRAALASFERAVRGALKIRPAGGKETPPIWSASDEEDFGAALRFIPSIQWHKLNDPQAARASLANGLRMLPDDHPLQALQLQMNQSQAPAAPALGPVH